MKNSLCKHSLWKRFLLNNCLWNLLGNASADYVFDRKSLTFDHQTLMRKKNFKESPRSRNAFLYALRKTQFIERLLFKQLNQSYGCVSDSSLVSEHCSDLESVTCCKLFASHLDFMSGSSQRITIVSSKTL